METLSIVHTTILWSRHRSYSDSPGGSAEVRRQRFIASIGNYGSKFILDCDALIELFLVKGSSRIPILRLPCVAMSN